MAPRVPNSRLVPCLSRHVTRCYAHSRYVLISRALFSTTRASRTDGVFRKLTEMRVPIPWIKALRERQRQREKELGSSSSTSTSSSAAGAQTQEGEQELVPKRMSDSYVSVVLPLEKDPWLSDTYLNSEGNIR
jgi:acyl-coenzyme A thioesterase 9